VQPQFVWKWWPRAELSAGFASSHFVRLSVLRTSVEMRTRGFSVAKDAAQGSIYQPVTGASVASFASPYITMRS